jgi:hypothetical protein
LSEGRENFSALSMNTNRELGVVTQSLVAMRAVAAARGSDMAGGTRVAA